MVVRPTSNYLERKFKASWIGGVLATVRSRRSAKKQINARFLLASSREKHSARQLRFWCGTKTQGQRTTWRSRRNFGRHTPTSLTKRNMEFGTGKVEDVPRPGKRAA